MMKKILLFDNYDSFTYNLLHAIKELGHTNIEVHRNDKITLEEIDQFDKIVLSPGPGIPQEAGILLPLIQKYAPSKSILGICLGHQAIAEAFGAKLINLKQVYHGVSTPIRLIREDQLFEGVDQTPIVGRYHSWIVANENLPKELEVIAEDENKDIMAIRHSSYDVRGVQFHPESILTPQGKEMIRNWLEN